MNTPDSKTYFVREKCFCYNDEGFGLEEGFGCVQSSFDNLEEAKQSLKEHTHYAFRGMKMMEYNPISYMGSKDELQEIDDFLKKELGKGIFDDTATTPYSKIDYDYILPYELTVEQAWKLRKLTGIHKYELIEGTKEKPTFWGFKFGGWSVDEGKWMSREASRWDEAAGKRIYKDIPNFYNSREIAFKMFEEELELATYNLKDDAVRGSFEELSDTPIILKSFVEHNKKVKYDFDSQEFSDLEYLGKKLVIFNSLLKIKLAEVVPFPTEEIIALGTDWNLDYS